MNWHNTSTIKNNSQDALLDRFNCINVVLIVQSAANFANILSSRLSRNASVCIFSISLFIDSQSSKYSSVILLNTQNYKPTFETLRQPQQQKANMTESALTKKDTRRTLNSEEVAEPEQRFFSFIKVYEDNERRRMQSIQNYDIIKNLQIKTSTDKKDEGEKQRGRKSRKDQENRNFVCGCGKKYLSYPALYTHIKTKHNMIAPNNTIKPNAQNGGARNPKRGRPPNVKPLEDIHSIDENAHKNEISAILKDSVNIEKSHLMEQYENQVKGTVFSDCIDYPVFLKMIEEVQRERPASLYGELVIDKVLAIYLYNMTNHFNEQMMRILQDVFVLLRECINQCGYRIQDRYESKTGVCRPVSTKNKDAKTTIELRHHHSNKNNATQTHPKEQCYSSTHSCEYLPLIGEYFVQKYVPRRIPELNQKVLSLMMLDFFSWLSEHRLTTVAVTQATPDLISSINSFDICC